MGLAWKLYQVTSVGPYGLRLLRSRLAGARRSSIAASTPMRGMRMRPSVAAGGSPYFALKSFSGCSRVASSGTTVALKSGVGVGIAVLTTAVEVPVALFWLVA